MQGLILVFEGGKISLHKGVIKRVVIEGFMLLRIIDDLFSLFQAFVSLYLLELLLIARLDIHLL